jgi:hypothetical protein
MIRLAKPLPCYDETEVLGKALMAQKVDVIGVGAKR